MKPALFVFEKGRLSLLHLAHIEQIQALVVPRLDQVRIVVVDCLRCGTQNVVPGIFRLGGLRCETNRVPQEELEVNEIGEFISRHQGIGVALAAWNGKIIIYDYNYNYN